MGHGVFHLAYRTQKVYRGLTLDVDGRKLFVSCQKDSFSMYYGRISLGRIAMVNLPPMSRPNDDVSTGATRNVSIPQAVGNNDFSQDHRTAR